jgi:hypothetical protein
MLIFVTEIAIALFSVHRFVRGFLGDVLVIPLLYFLLRSFFFVKSFKLTAGIVGFAIFVELLQYFQLYKLFGLSHGILYTIIGATYDPLDLLAYVMGGVLCWLIDRD